MHEEGSSHHPLAATLTGSKPAIGLASIILTVLRLQVQELNESQRRNGQWLDSTVSVLRAFSETLGIREAWEGVGSVCFRR